MKKRRGFVKKKRKKLKKNRVEVEGRPPFSFVCRVVCWPRPFDLYLCPSLLLSLPLSSLLLSSAHAPRLSSAFSLSLFFS